MTAMIRTLLAPLGLLMLGIAPVAAAGTLTWGQAESPALGRPMPYGVYATAGAGGCARLPVLYLLHGHGGRGRDWIEHGELERSMDTLRRQAAIPEMLVVMPDGGDGWWIDSGAGRFGQAWTHDLVADVERRWPTGGAASRLSAGQSAGGFGVLSALLRQPHRFAAVGAMSPAAYADLPPSTSAARIAPPFRGPEGFDPALWRAATWPALWDGYARSGHRVPVHLGSGDQDTLGIALEAARIHERFRQLQPGRATLRVVAGGHDWSVWKTMLPGLIVQLTEAVPLPLCPPQGPPERNR